eukprot:GHVS01031962.1.p1 GENE.GHVS01031962.1~~GHVS01031962.1.p1  ORF type:complete len:756 (+),score=158.07 GHVS01031962.1:127-2394(+)
MAPPPPPPRCLSSAVMYLLCPIAALLLLFALPAVQALDYSQLDELEMVEELIDKIKAVDLMASTETDTTKEENRQTVNTDVMDEEREVMEKDKQQVVQKGEELADVSWILSSFKCILNSVGEKKFNNVERIADRTKFISRIFKYIELGDSLLERRNVGWKSDNTVSCFANELKSMMSQAAGEQQEAGDVELEGDVSQTEKQGETFEGVLEEDVSKLRYLVESLKAVPKQKGNILGNGKKQETPYERVMDTYNNMEPEFEFVQILYGADEEFMIGLFGTDGLFVPKSCRDDVDSEHTTSQLNVFAVSIFETHQFQKTCLWGFAADDFTTFWKMLLSAVGLDFKRAEPIVEWKESVTTQRLKFLEAINDYTKLKTAYITKTPLNMITINVVDKYVKDGKISKDAGHRIVLMAPQLSGVDLWSAIVVACKESALNSNSPDSSNLPSLEEVGAEYSAARGAGEFAIIVDLTQEKFEKAVLALFRPVSFQAMQVKPCSVQAVRATEVDGCEDLNLLDDEETASQPEQLRPQQLLLLQQLEQQQQLQQHHQQPYIEGAVGGGPSTYDDCEVTPRRRPPTTTTTTDDDLFTSNGTTIEEQKALYEILKKAGKRDRRGYSYYDDSQAEEVRPLQQHSMRDCVIPKHKRNNDDSRAHRPTPQAQGVREKRLAALDGNMNNNKCARETPNQTDDLTPKLTTFSKQLKNRGRDDYREKEERPLQQHSIVGGNGGAIPKTKKNNGDGMKETRGKRLFNFDRKTQKQP